MVVVVVAWAAVSRTTTRRSIRQPAVVQVTRARQVVPQEQTVPRRRQVPQVPLEQIVTAARVGAVAVHPVQQQPRVSLAVQVDLAAAVVAVGARVRVQLAVRAVSAVTATSRSLRSDIVRRP